jgi:hypothetical protein
MITYKYTPWARANFLMLKEVVQVVTIMLLSINCNLNSAPHYATISMKQRPVARDYVSVLFSEAGGPTLFVFSRLLIQHTLGYTPYWRQPLPAAN